MNDQEKTLPEKCCAKCGFLYAISKPDFSTSKTVFDPDLLRKTDFGISGNLTENSAVASAWYRPGGKDGVRDYALKDIIYLSCLQNVFWPEGFDAGMNITDHPQKEAQRMLALIRRSRNDTCNARLLDYHPGFSA